MIRLARVVLPGVVHHVTQRGVRSMNIFPHVEDRTVYIKLLNEQANKREMTFVSYCLMDNHVHFLVIPKEEKDLSRVFGETHRLYTRSINFREKTRGFLFQGRFFSCPLDDYHLLTAARYVERNPVRAGMCKSPEAYQWSSARFNLKLTVQDPFILQRHPLIDDLDAWKKWLRTDPKEIEVLRKSFRIGRPLGSESFLKNAELTTGRSLRPQKPGPKTNN